MRKKMKSFLVVGILVLVSLIAGRVLWKKEGREPQKSVALSSPPVLQKGSQMPFNVEALEKYAASKGIAVREEEIEKAWQEEKKKYKQEADFYKELQAFGLTIEKAREQVKMALLIQKIKNQIKIQPEEIAQFKKEAGENKSEEEIVEELKMQKLSTELQPYLNVKTP